MPARTTWPPTSSAPRSSATGCRSSEVADVYMGCTNQAGRGQPQRRAHGARCWRACRSRCPGVTVNRLCASGLEAVNQASRALRLGDGDLFLAGGVESMTRAPLAMPKPDRSFPRGNQTVYDTTIGWRFVNPRMEELYSTESMGETAENVAERYGISRERQDEFALASHRRAVAAAEAGSLRRGDRAGPGAPAQGRPGHGPRRRRTARATRSLEKLAQLRPVFREGGTRHRRQRLDAQRRRGLRGARERAACRALWAVSRWRGSCRSAWPASTPRTWASVPCPATRMALERAGLEIDDIDLVELNEAFAAQVLACMRRARDPAREAERERRRDRARPSAWLLGRAHPHDADLGDAPPRRSLRARDDVHRRRAGMRHDRREPSRHLNLLCSIDGEIVSPIEDARIAVTDDGFLRGDGAFEVLRLYDGKPFALTITSTGSARSADGIFLEWDRPAFESEIAALLEANESPRRVPAPGRHARRPPARDDGARARFAHDLVLQSVTYQPTIVLTGLKTLSYAANMTATRIAMSRGAKEALLVAPGGKVLEAPTSTIFWATEDGVAAHAEARRRHPRLDHARSHHEGAARRGRRVRAQRRARGLGGIPRLERARGAGREGGRRRQLPGAGAGDPAGLGPAVGAHPGRAVRVSGRSAACS